MRPLALEMQGFSAFQDLTSINFRDHDLIAFTGPTGAGKSSIIDAIVFALYGSVTRYGNETLVAPIINALSTEARVRFDFSVAETEYTAVRVVRRTANGASTKEARLECGTEVLASTEKELTAEVENILGLSFSQFTKTVVLPQGDFARFLTEKASSRQKLLRRLLGLDLFVAVGSAARRRARELAAQKKAFEAALSDGAPISEKQVEKLATQLTVLDGAVAELTKTLDGRSQAAAELDLAIAELAQLDQHIEALDGLSIPPEAQSFATAMKRAESDLAAATKKCAAADTKLASMIEKRSALLPSGELDELVEQHERLAELRVSLGLRTSTLKAASAALAESTTNAEMAASQLAGANEMVENARVLAGALGIAATLEVGDSCPVCDQIVDRLPAHAAHDIEDVTAAEAKRATARKQAAAAIEAVQAATAAHADVATRFETLEVTIEELATALKDQPTLKQSLALRSRAEASGAKVEDAAGLQQQAIEARDLAEAALAAAAADGAALRRQFTEARDDVSALSPPQPSEESLTDDWRELVAWAKEERSSLVANRRVLAKNEKELTKRVNTLEKTILSLIRPFAPPAVQPEVAGAAKILSNAHADARVAFANAEDRLARHVATQKQLADVEAERRLTDDLGKLLISGNFERWIMTDVMHDLAERASVRLNDLSAGSFSITTDGTDFQIRDHRNADELRSARTLSGGETFLTSLALSLALAESITELASSATPPLESMFLDEGFGTLDSETLDTVAAAIEELGASGRMIGVVTHIRELADRLPTRFDVQRGPRGSTVTEQTAVQ